MVQIFDQNRSKTNEEQNLCRFWCKIQIKKSWDFSWSIPKYSDFKFLIFPILDILLQTNLFQITRTLKGFQNLFKIGLLKVKLSRKTIFPPIPTWTKYSLKYSWFLLYFTSLKLSYDHPTNPNMHQNLQVGSTCHFYYTLNPVNCTVY
jgi:hypothetical protein